MPKSSSPDRQIINLLISQRILLGMTQKDVAKLMRTDQPAVSVMESKKDSQLTLRAIRRYAAAVGWKLVVKFEE